MTPHAALIIYDGACIPIVRLLPNVSQPRPGLFGEWRIDADVTDAAFAQTRWEPWVAPMARQLAFVRNGALNVGFAFLVGIDTIQGGRRLCFLGTGELQW